MKALKGFILAATFAVAPLLLIADSELYDVQFEVDGSTYVLSNQTLPLELTVDDQGTGSLDDILKNLLVSPQYCRCYPGSSWWQSINCPLPDMYAASLDNCGTGALCAYRLTISAPFVGYAELGGEYETTETYWDFELEEEVTNTYTTVFDNVRISILNYNGPGGGGGVVSVTVGQVIGADGNFYTDADDALMNGTTTEAMVAYIDPTTGTGLAIALEDANDNKVAYNAAIGNIIPNWANEHPVLLGEWRLPSVEDWMLMFEGCGGDVCNSALVGQSTSFSPTAFSFSSGYFSTMLVNAGGDDLSDYYFSDTLDVNDNGNVWRYNFTNSVFESVAVSPKGRSLVRACLAFEVPVWPGMYAMWADMSGVAGAWNVTDADGIANVFRYAFDMPSGTFSPITNITFNAEGKAVIDTPIVVNTSGFTYSIVASDDVGGTENVATYPLSTDGTTLIDEPRKPRRFFRLRANLE